MTEQRYESAQVGADRAKDRSGHPFPRTALIGLSLVLVGTAGGWYFHEGFATTPTPAAYSFFSAVRQRDSAVAYAMLTPTSQQNLTPGQFAQLTSGLGKLLAGASNLPTSAVKSSGLFARNATLELPANDSTLTENLPSPPLALQLDHGQWRIDPTALYARAMLTGLLNLDNMIPRGASIEQHFSGKSNVDAAAAAERAQADKMLTQIRTWSEKARQLDATFNGDNVVNRATTLRKALDPALTSAVKAVKINAARNKIDALLVQAEGLYTQDENDQAQALYEQVLANGNATNEQRENANYYLAHISSEGIVKERDQALEEAKLSYDRAQYTEAIASLQNLLSQDGLTDAMRGRANYLLSFAFRDDKDVPNNMQKSIDSARAATDVQPSNGDYWCTLGDRLRQYEVRNESSRSFLKGISLATENNVKANCYVWYGWNLYASEDYGGANDAWNTALELEPTNPDALRALRQ